MNRLRIVLVSFVLVFSILVVTSCGFVRKIDDETETKETVSDVVNKTEETDEKIPETIYIEDETNIFTSHFADTSTVYIETVYETTSKKETQVDTKFVETTKKPIVQTQASAETEIKTPETTQVSTTIPEEVVEPYRPWLNIGRCKKLEGELDVRIFFIDDDVSSWDETTVEVFTNVQIKLALDFLKAQAVNWGIELDFITQSYATILNEGYEMKYKGTVNNNLDRAPSTKDVLDQAAVCLGYESKEEMDSIFKSQNGSKEIIYLTFLNEDGTSYTRNQIKKGVNYVEHCVIFAANINQPNVIIGHTSRAVAIAHEILHLFGAQDYYTPEVRRKIAEELYIKDIMLEAYRSISVVEIGDLTAYSIGWTDDIPEVCYNDDWWLK